MQFFVVSLTLHVKILIECYLLIWLHYMRNKGEARMSLMDDMKSKANDMMNDPDKKAKIEQMAKDTGISIEEAKEHFMKSHQE